MNSSAGRDAAIFFAANLTWRHLLTRRILPAVLLIAAVILVAATVLSTEADQSTGTTPIVTKTARPMPVSVTLAEKSSTYVRQRAYTGTLIASRRSELGFPRPGKVIRIHVDEGEHVLEDQVLAELDPRHLMAQRQVVKGRLAEAQAVLEELVAGPRKESIAAAEAEVRNLEAQRELAQKKLVRRQQLVGETAITPEEYDESYHEYHAASARLHATQKVLEELLAGSRTERIAAQRARVRQLQAAQLDANYDLQDTILRAPFDGYVAIRRVDDGVFVAAGTPVLDLIENGNLEAWVGVPPQVASKLSEGEPFSVLVRGVPYQASIKAIRPELDTATRTRSVVFAMKPSPTAPPLVAGQIARILLSESVDDSGVWVPTGALSPGERGLWSVYVAAAEGDTTTVAVRDVEVLYSEGDRSFVRGTLQPGEQVIAEGVHRVVEGQHVRIARQQRYER